MKHPHHSRAANALRSLAVGCVVAAGLAASPADADNPLTSIVYEPTHVLLQPTLWHETGWPRVNERTLATVELTDSRLELVEIQFEISIADPHASPDAQTSPYCKALYQLVEVSVDAFGAPQRRELFAPRLMRPALAECVGEAWPSELDLDSWGGSPEGARVLMENLVQVVQRGDEQQPMIAFLSDGQAADGGAWHMVVAPIVMGRVRMELAEVVWRGWLEGTNVALVAGPIGEMAD
jgi:hypothetical protein